MAFPFRPIKLKKPEEFFTSPTELSINLEEIRCDCEPQNHETLQREMEAWSELGEYVVGQEVPNKRLD